MRALMVCSTGGHLSELLHWRERIEPAPTETIWVTHNRANAPLIQLHDPAATTYFVPPVEPKQLQPALALAPYAVQLIREFRPDVIVSSGAAIAVPFALAAQRTRTPFHFIESAARIEGPSLSGRLVQLLPTSRCWSTSSRWARWGHTGSLFDLYSSHPRPPVDRIASIVVALGTQSQFEFRAAINSVRSIFPDLHSTSVLWQVGNAHDLSSLDGSTARKHIPEDELFTAMRRADVVITHAGVGLAALSLRAGKLPIVLPRRRHRQEHTDDHQTELAAWLASRRLAVTCEAPMLTPEILLEATKFEVESTPSSELNPLVLTTPSPLVTTQ